MACIWLTETAEEFCDAVKDGTHDSPKQKTDGYKLITSKHISNGTIELDSAYFISAEDYGRINKRSKVEKDDVLFSMIGTVGRICRVDFNPAFAIKNMGLFKLHDELKSKWLYYYLYSAEARKYLNGVLAGSTQKYISLASLRSFPIRFPSLREDMYRIIRVLDLLDNKITLNAKLNGYLAA